MERQVRYTSYTTKSFRGVITMSLMSYKLCLLYIRMLLPSLLLYKKSYAWIDIFSGGNHHLSSSTAKSYEYHVR